MTRLRIGLLAAFALAGGAFGADEATLRKGNEVYDYWCATCHAAEGRMPGTMALQAKYNGSKPAALAERTDLAPAITKAFVRNGVSIMPFFRKTEIGNADLDALAEYLARNITAK
jgi:mono/diheme cytochrome c family protein